MDSALLRPGRFDRLLYVPPPDEAARAEILKIHTRATPLDEDVSFDLLAERTLGYTGADLAAVCQEAALISLQEDLAARHVSAHHFAAALEKVHRSAADADSVRMYLGFSRQV
jgi:transitional endoplasmic reticulum ATPase